MVRYTFIINRLNSLLVPFLTLLLIFAGCASTKKQAEVDSSLGENTEISEMPIKTEVSDLILGPGDEIEILVWRNNDLDRTIKVIPPGRYYYPLVGEIKTMGIGVFQLRDEIAEKLSKYIKDPQVSITIKSVESHKFFILGEVNHPGIFPVDSVPTALQAITAAGGVNADAKLNSVLLVRGNPNKPELRKLNLEVALKENNFRDNVVLQHGDMLYVPTVPIADVERFFERLHAIMGPFVDAATFYDRAIRKTAGRGTFR
ncbi:MAG TPA: polysaccharide biosynthesis/export family protein [Candidatus Brocadiia bacterium]|nr:polysaccharide biosynthesis/export family protein [Planctomycetota bacterium]MBI4007681.1 polysaccharide biosynthesis/export family protein [Planctomycetota bacterium]MDO8094498.1 polysaccharide biosynthesis/export family protein [Candidatus Brocadiales bacterium]